MRQRQQKALEEKQRRRREAELERAVRDFISVLIKRGWISMGCGLVRVNIPCTK